MEKFLMYYLIVINVITFFLYGIDKLKAILKKNRIREMVLLNFSLFGGAILGLVSMYLFHHKTKKAIFVIVNLLCAIIYIGIVVYVFYLR